MGETFERELDNQGVYDVFLKCTAPKKNYDSDSLPTACTDWLTLYLAKATSEVSVDVSSFFLNN